MLLDGIVAATGPPPITGEDAMTESPEGRTTGADQARAQRRAAETVDTPTRLRADDHVRGPDDGAVLLVYGDYECPFTRVAYRHVQRLEDRGIPFRFVFRHFPLTEVHPHALSASLAAEAAARQTQFWAMHDLLFHRQQALRLHDLVHYAERLDLQIPQFNADAIDRHTLTRVRRDMSSGAELGVQGTPVLFLNGIRLVSYEFSDLVAVLGEPPATVASV